METIHMIKKAFEDDSVGKVQIKFWYRRFKDGWESFESDPRSGRPATSGTPKNVEHVLAAINKNRRLTVQELEEDMGIPQTIVSEILMEDLGKKCLVAKFVSWLLSQDQKEFSVEGAEDLHETTDSDPDFLKKVITGDESWVYGCDPLMQTFLAKHHITQVCQSPCSPDLAPCNFWLFGKLKSPLKGRRFVSATVTQYSSVSSVSLPTY